jgi:hypothetical protein
MKLYRTLRAPVRFGTGQILHLSEEQVALRAHNLRVGELSPRTGAIEVEVVELVEFKAGELIWLPPAAVTRALELVLEFVGDAAPEPEPVKAVESAAQSPEPAPAPGVEPMEPVKASAPVTSSGDAGAAGEVGKIEGVDGDSEADGASDKAESEQPKQPDAPASTVTPHRAEPNKPAQPGALASGSKGDDAAASKPSGKPTVTLKSKAAK